jgi:hypothetical protein
LHAAHDRRQKGRNNQNEQKRLARESVGRGHASSPTGVGGVAHAGAVAGLQQGAGARAQSGAVRYAELSIDVVQMTLHRALGQIELLGN